MARKMSHLVIRNKNEAYVTIDCEEGVSYELRDHFTFMVPGAQYSPQFRNKIWDGRIRLFNVRSREIYRGLVPHITKFCKEFDHTYEYEDTTEEFSLLEAQDFISTLGLPEQFVPRDYQVDGFVHAIRNKRILLLSPTGSGKSLMLYLILRKIVDQGKVLIIVPTVNLVEQLASDFKNYGFDSDTLIHKIHAGIEKDSNKPIIISTWQSLFRLPPKYFHQFKSVICDEVHLAKAKSLTDILTKLVYTKYRFGTTGTLDGMKTNRLVLEGLFGSVRQVTTTKTLIDNQTLADFEVKCLLLKHDPKVSGALKKADYQTEIEYLINSDSRNQFIINLALSLKDNTLILFNYIRHGEELKRLVEAKVEESRPVYFIYGKTEADIREESRHLIEKSTNAIILASSGVFSTGVNIVNLNSVIFASPSKSRIRVLQSIGRVLRRSDSKISSVLFDIADDLTHKKHENHTYKHFTTRLQYYAEEKFKFRMYKITLKGK
jgi:superfamily II DNA or RNA helicase